LTCRRSLTSSKTALAMASRSSERPLPCWQGGRAPPSLVSLGAAAHIVRREDTELTLRARATQCSDLPCHPLQSLRKTIDPLEHVLGLGLFARRGRLAADTQRRFVTRTAHAGHKDRERGRHALMAAGPRVCLGGRRDS
jgi:hypothetical protein